MAFDLDAFMADLESESKKKSDKPRSAMDRLNRILMNTKDNQGTLQMVPFISKKFNSIYAKIEGVREFNGYTSIIDREDPVWYKILPIEFYGNLTQEQIELYSEVVSLYDSLYDTGKIDYDEIRSRNYSLFFGVAVKMIRAEDGSEIKDFLDVPSLFIYPSSNVIDNFSAALISKRSAIGADKIGLYLQDIISPALKGRKGIIQITYTKANIGYDANIGFERNGDFNTFIDPNKEFSEEFASKFDDPIATFLGWMYDRDNNAYFNESVFVELKKNLLMRLKEVTSESESNSANTKSEVLDTAVTPIPGVTGITDTNNGKKRPF